jgi:hypothetical protein
MKALLVVIGSDADIHGRVISSTLCMLAVLQYNRAMG